MSGPLNPAAAPEGARGGQYVTVPAFASPGHSAPANTRDAPGSTVVYSPKGWRWEEAGDDYSKTVSKLTSATMESAVRRIQSSMGEVYYIRGTESTQPPFDGTAIGDTCRVQDAQTLNIVAEWRWNGTTWERMKVTSEQISNLDVGKLTAGAANIAEIAARKIASDVGRFLEITTDQLTVTGNASFVNATAHHVWSAIVTAEQGEFEQIKAGMLAANSVNADNIQAGAINGQVITGATIQTSNTANQGLKITGTGMQVYADGGWKSLDINAQTGAIEISGHISRRDSWSQVYFNDIVDRGTGTDMGASGNKWGCGLAFKSLEDEWWDGTIAIEKGSDGTPALRIQGPISKTVSYSSPYISVGQAAISMYTPQHNGSFLFNAFGINLQTQSVYLWGNNQGFSFGTKSDNTARLYVGTTNSIMRPLQWTVGGFWATSSSVTMEWDNKNQVWIGSDGVHITGTKKFTMRVPGETSKRGLWLDHSATESPYDGIEYWEAVTLDSDGRARWVLPDYVPKIASEKAPWIVLASDGAKAALTRTGFGVDAAPWYVDVTGDPGATVSVLVKGARQIDADTAEDGEPIMRDYARESPWRLGPPSSDDAQDGGGSLGGGAYGPAPQPEENPSE